MLPRKDPFGQNAFPAVAGGAGDESIVGVDYVEGASVCGFVCRCAIGCSSVRCFGQACHDAVIVVVGVGEVMSW